MPGLVDLILHDVGHEPGALPSALTCPAGDLAAAPGTHPHNERVHASAGGVRGAIAETAEAVFTDQFNPRTASHSPPHLSRALTELGDVDLPPATRAGARLITELILKPEETDATHLVLKALADARLVTTSEEFRPGRARGLDP